MHALVMVTVAAMATVAHAGIALEREPTRLLDGRVKLRLAAAMIERDADTAVLDWGATRFTMTAAMAASTGARADVVVGAPTPFEVPDADRVVVYTARRAAIDGSVCVLRFYVSRAVRDVRPWATLARAIAATLEVRPTPMPTPLRPRAHIVAPPRGWRVTSDGLHHRIDSPHGRCEIADEAVDIVSQAPADASFVAGVVRGTDVYWSVWMVDGIARAETMVGARHIGYVHIECRARTRDELAQQRAFVERLWR